MYIYINIYIGIVAVQCLVQIANVGDWGATDHTSLALARRYPGARFQRLLIRDISAGTGLVSPWMGS